MKLKKIPHLLPEKKACPIHNMGKSDIGGCNCSDNKLINQALQEIGEREVELDEVAGIGLLQRLFVLKNSVPDPSGIAMAPDPDEIIRYLNANLENILKVDE